MKIGVDEFWDVLRRSHLLTPGDAEAVYQKEMAKFDAEAGSETESEPATANQIAKSLVQEKTLTALQAKVLLAGHSGPFEFGRYRLLAASAPKDVFLARDRKTGFPVRLHFFAGETTADLQRWDGIESRVEAASKIQHPNLIRVYEWVVTPTHRFAVTAVAAAETLDEKLPLKRRLPLKQAQKMIRQIAGALAAIHDAGLVHGDLQLNSVHLNPKGKVQLSLPMMVANVSADNVDADKREQRARGWDVQAMGALAHRMLTGRDAPDPESLPKIDAKKFCAQLQQKEIPQPLGQLLHDALVAGTTENAAASISAADFVRRLDALDGSEKDAAAKVETEAKVSSVEAVFIDTLVPWAKAASKVPDVVPEIAANESVAVASETAVPKNRRRANVPLMLAASLAGFAAVVALLAWLANLKTLEPPRVAVVKDAGETELFVEASQTNAEKLETLSQLLQSQSYVQELVPDDFESLWESPTTGFPISAEHLPRSPRMLFAINWASLYGSEAGSRAIQSLGPRFGSLLQRLESTIGFPLVEIESTRLSLHSNEQFEYEPFSLVELRQNVSSQRCLAAWKNPEPEPGLPNCYTDAATDIGYWIVKQNVDQDADQVKSFVVGPASLVRDVADGKAVPVSGTMLRLIENSDALRDVNLLLPKASLFNTEGRKLFAEVDSMMRDVRLFLPDSIRGMTISLHFEAGDYVEFQIDHTADVRATELANLLRAKFNTMLSETGEAFRGLRASNYWEPIRKRFAAMLRETAQQIRWDTEFGNVIGNAWLRPGAVHNLAAATELTMTFKPAAETMVAVSKKTTPQTLAELLAANRDLKIANPPDLNVLLQDIRNEVVDQYPELPFEFNIRIAGADLQNDGITQNQRPAALEITDRSLSDILTSVMVAANPNRNISGAADPQCKLVWVVADDPDGGTQPVILVTTRTAALNQGLDLPAAFVPVGSGE